MHVSAFYASSVLLGTHPHMWLHCIYTRELALTKPTRYTTQHNQYMCVYTHTHIYK